MFERIETIKNLYDHHINVWFEPWGVVHQLSPGETFDIATRSEIDGRVEVESSSDRIVIYAFPSATMKITLNDELVEHLETRVPELPPNTSMKSFVSEFLRPADD